MNFFKNLWLRRQVEDDLDKEMERYLLIGLGNPGRKYHGNRHNIGFMAIDRLAEQFQIEGKKVQNKAIVAHGRIHNKAVIIAKPQTFMNSSGDSVGPLATFYKVEPENILVIYDEIDLPFGTIRLRENGGAGGHNGMKSIINHLGEDFPRLRLGVSRPPGQMPVPAYVLQDFHKNDLPLVNEILDESVKAIETYLQDGVQLAMSKHNRNLVQ